MQPRFGGQPGEAFFRGRAAERAKTLGVVHTALSLTHSRTVAMAVVVVEGPAG